jgi:hypothetical protein
MSLPADTFPDVDDLKKIFRCDFEGQTHSAIVDKVAREFPRHKWQKASEILDGTDDS